MKKTRKEAKSTFIEALKLACFNQKHSEVTQDFDKAAVACAAQHHVKSKLTLSALRTLSLHCILECDAIF